MQHDDKYLDDAIDRTVQGMLDADPAAGLQRRVLAEIEEPEARHRWALPRLAIAALGVAIVALAIATLIRTPSREVPKIASTQAAPAVRQPVTPAPPETTTTAPVPLTHPEP